MFFVIPLSLLAVCASAQQSAPKIQVVQVPASANANGTIVFVQPVANFLSANSSVPASTLSCTVRENLLPAGAKCVVNDCAPRFRKIECNNASVSDLNSTFSTYLENARNAYDDKGAALPLYVRLSGLSGNLSRSTLAPLAGQIKSLELVHVYIDNMDDFGNDLTNLTNLDFNGVENDRITAGAFDTLPLKVLQIRNMKNLRLMDKGSLEPVISKSAGTCLSVNIENEAFICDCSTNSWIQTTLFTNSKNLTTNSVPQMYSQNETAIPCGVYIMCSSKSPEAFRQKLLDINLNATCPATSASTNATKMNTDVVTTTAKTGNSAPELRTNALGLSCLFVVLYAVLAMV